MKEKGITLIALIVTVIVLIILAGISISSLTGEDGTVLNASKAKLKTEVKDIEEQIELKEINENDGEDFQFGTLKELIGREDEYNEILYMEDGELVYIKENVSERQAEWLEEMGIKEKQNIIPIYTEKQFRKIGTGEEIEIEEVGGEKFKFNIDSHYILQNDIDLKCSKENQWIPIGTVNKPFDGILEGKGYKIKGIYIDEGENIGLFGYNNGTIENINLEGYLNGSNFIGAVVANNRGNGKVVGCTNNVEMYASRNGNGAIVGRNEGLIENCENNAYVEFNATSGGICGNNAVTGIIRKCKNTHEILLKDFDIGGIVGLNAGIVEECCNTGNILVTTKSGRYSKGGIVGTNSGSIKYCFNIARVEGNKNWNVGGITGNNETNGRIEFSYNAGEVIGNVKIGGMVGSNSGNIKNSYAIDNIELISENTGNIENCLQLTENQLKNKEKIILEDKTETNIIELLNKEEEKYKEDIESQNKGYPIFK